MVVDGNVMVLFSSVLIGAVFMFFGVKGYGMEFTSFIVLVFIAILTVTAISGQLMVW